MGLSLSQSYFLCGLNKKGKISPRKTETVVSMTASVVVELLLENVFSCEKKRLKANCALPENRGYLVSVYEFVKAKQPVKIEKMIEHYGHTFSGKYMRAVTDSIGNSLSSAGYVSKKKAGLFRNKNAYVPDPKAVEEAVLPLRAEFLEGSELTAETVVLAVLLDKCGNLKRYFTSRGRKIIRKRLKEIRNTPQYEIVQKAVSCTDIFLEWINLHTK